MKKNPRRTKYYTLLHTTTYYFSHCKAWGHLYFWGGGQKPLKYPFENVHYFIKILINAFQIQISGGKDFFIIKLEVLQKPLILYNKKCKMRKKDVSKNFLPPATRSLKTCNLCLSLIAWFCPNCKLCIKYNNTFLNWVMMLQFWHDQLDNVPGLQTWHHLHHLCEISGYSK